MKKIRKMKQFSLAILGVFLFALGAAAGNSENGKTVYNVDVKQSNVKWVGKKVGGEHSGTLSLSSGEVVAESGKVSNANITLDMNSIACTDLTDPEWNQKLVGHLKSDDFFSVEQFPKATFVTTSFKKASGSDAYTVTGKLTIKGITNEISFPATVTVSNGQLTAKGTATVDRAKYNIKYSSGSFFENLGDKMIYDDMEIEFNLVAKAK